MTQFISLLALGAAVVAGQQVYLPQQGPIPSQCADSHSHGQGATPSYNYRAFHEPFSYTLTETVRTAKGVTPPPTPLPTFAKPYNAVSSLFANVSTTSWGNWEPSATTSPPDSKNPYGQEAWSSLWANAGLPNFTRGFYSTTVSPTAVPTSELILPPPRYFEPKSCYTFPRDFIWGVAGSASQVEGAVADEGRSPTFAELTSTGSIGGDDKDYSTRENYYLYKQDIERLAAIGNKYYSFSISWARILPFALPGTPVNWAGLKHYDDLINFALSKGVQPVVTLVHFDVPLSVYSNVSSTLSERAYYGFANMGYGEPAFQEAFVNYGKLVMAHFADRVPIWITINEPQMGTVSGPALYNVIKSHARLHHFYKEVLNGTGRISTKMAQGCGVPQDPQNASHLVATEHFNDLKLGAFLNPIALGLDYPEAYKMTIQDYVPLSQEDLAYMNNTLGKLTGQYITIAEECILITGLLRFRRI